MSLNQHVRLVADAELGAIVQGALAEAVDAPQAVPRLLHVLADGRQLREAFETGTWPAPDARHAGEAALGAYALPLLHAFLDERSARRPGRPASPFGEELGRGIDPQGSHFERYLVRMYEGPGVAAALERSRGRAAYAPGLRTAELDIAVPGDGGRRSFELASAVYDAARQRAMLERIFSAIDTWHGQACMRFGPRGAEQVLASCREAFRRALGAVLPRFRPPQLAAEREWLASARWRRPTRFELAGELLVPALSLRARAAAKSGWGLPVERTLVHAGLPQPLAADGLRYFHRFHALPARVAVAAPGITAGK